MNTLKNRLEEVMKEYNLKTQQDLANFAEVSKGLVNQWFKGETGLGAKPLIAFEKKTHFSTQWLADGKGKKYRDTNINATGVKFGDNATIGDSNNFSVNQFSGSLKNEFTDKMPDPSMSRLIPKDSELWINYNNTTIEDGKIYLIELRGLKTVRTLVQQDLTHIRQIPENKDLYAESVVPLDEIKIIGRVTAWKVNEQ